MNLCSNKLEKLNTYSYKLDEETCKKCECTNCIDDYCNNEILVYSEEEFKTELEKLIIKLDKCEKDEIAVHMLSGHYSEYYNDIDSLFYIAGVIVTYNKKLKWNSVWLGNSLITKIKHINKKAISDKEYQKYYKKYSDIIDKIYDKL